MPIFQLCRSIEQPELVAFRRARPRTLSMNGVGTPTIRPRSQVTVNNASISSGLPCSAFCNIDVLVAPSARALSNISSTGTVAGIPMAAPIRPASSIMRQHNV
jgi:hypothetical protein